MPTSGCFRSQSQNWIPWALVISTTISLQHKYGSGLTDSPHWCSFHLHNKVLGHYIFFFNMNQSSTKCWQRSTRKEAETIAAMEIWRKAEVWQELLQHNLWGLFVFLNAEKLCGRRYYCLAVEWQTKTRTLQLEKCLGDIQCKIWKSPSTVPMLTAVTPHSMVGCKHIT